MEPTILLDGQVQIFTGDCLGVLSSMEPDSVDCVVTSPPYWGLRDYGVDGQIGLERSLGEHLEVMVRVFDAVKRLLKPEGTVWLNYGDCYATTPNGSTHLTHDGRYKSKRDDRTFTQKPFSTVGPIYQADRERGDRRGDDCIQHNHDNGVEQHRGRIVAGGMLKPKDLCMVPNRLAIALQEAGWWVRSEIIWAKPNPMPESVKDRPATSHEKIFMLTKSPRYYCDMAAVAQPVSKNTHARLAQDVMNQIGSERANGGKKTNGNMKAVGRKVAAPSSGIKNNESMESALSLVVDRRNLRNYEPAPPQVWNIPTRSFSEAHFATFPPELATRCILAGCPKGGLVLDPFGGAGTTALAAARHGRRSHLVELNPEYVAITRKRIEDEWRVPQKDERAPEGPLFDHAGLS